MNKTNNKTVILKMFLKPLFQLKIRLIFSTSIELNTKDFFKQWAIKHGRIRTYKLKIGVSISPIEETETPLLMYTCNCTDFYFDIAWNKSDRLSDHQLYESCITPTMFHYFQVVSRMAGGALLPVLFDVKHGIFHGIRATYIKCL